MKFTVFSGFLSKAKDINNVYGILYEAYKCPVYLLSIYQNTERELLLSFFMCQTILNVLNKRQ